MRSASRLIPLLSMLCLPVAAQAQTPPNCTAAVAPGAPWSGWTTPANTPAAGHTSHLAPPDVPLGKALHLTLLPQGKVKFPLQPGKAGAPGSYAGLLNLTITTPGTYRVALGTGAWIDLVDNARSVNSAGHDHGPACSGIHKIVNFPLHAGGYTLQISGNTEPQTTVMVVQAP